MSFRTKLPTRARIHLCYHGPGGYHGPSPQTGPSALPRQPSPGPIRAGATGPVRGREGCPRDNRHPRPPVDRFLKDTLSESTPEDERRAPSHSPVGTHHLHIGFPHGVGPLCNKYFGRETNRNVLGQKNICSKHIKLNILQTEGAAMSKKQRAEKKRDGTRKGPEVMIV